MKEKIKCCPFCARNNRIVPLKSDGRLIFCDNCGNIGITDGKDCLIKKDDLNRIFTNMGVPK